MASLINYHHLPRVSLAKLYQSYISSSNTSKNQQGIIAKAHNQNIKIQSPFYEKHQLHKGPCSCAYHRMKRYKQKGVIRKDDPNTKMKDAIILYKFRIAAAVKAAGGNAKSNIQQVFNSQKIERPLRNTENKKVSRSQSVTQVPNVKAKVNLDNYNYFFEEVLRKRIQPMQEYEKVANLIRFIKLQSNYDLKYLTKTKDYIYLHLLKIVQKIPWSQLSDIGEGDANTMKLIAQISNCKQQFALELLKGIQKAIKDMEGFIVQRMKQSQSQDQANFPTGNFKYSEIGSVLQKNGVKNMNNENGLDYFEDDDGNLIDSQVIDNFENKQNILGSLDLFINKDKKLRLDGLGNQSGISRHQSLLNSLSSSSRKKAGHINSKKSNIFLDQQKLSVFSSLANTTKVLETPVISQQNSQQSNIKDKIQQNRGKRLSKDITSNLHEKGNFRRSKFNPNFTGKSSGKAEDQQSYDGKIYENEGNKERKGQLHNKRRQSKPKQVPCPFKDLNYTKLVSKEQFERIKHILNDNRSPYADEQRMRKLFQYIQRRVSGNSQFFEQFLTKFEVVLTPEQVNLLKQKYQKYQFQKMIYKLTKQVDGCLLQLKNSQDLIWKQQQDDDIRGQRNASPTKKTINLECIQSDIGLIQQFEKFTVIQSSAPPIPIQQDTQLQQIGLGQIELHQFEVLPETNFKSLYEKCYKIKSRSKPPEELEWKNSIVNEQQHRRILRYMKSRYPSAFNEVKQNIHGALQLNNSSLF